MPLSGRLPVLVRSFGLGRAIEVQDGVDTDFPDSLGNGGPLCADSEFGWYSWLRSPASMATRAPLERVPAKSANFPKAGAACYFHSYAAADSRPKDELPSWLTWMQSPV
jgi:hypothetical protein